MKTFSILVQGRVSAETPAAEDEALSRVTEVGLTLVDKLTGAGAEVQAAGLSVSIAGNDAHHVPHGTRSIDLIAGHEGTPSPVPSPAGEGATAVVQPEATVVAGDVPPATEPVAGS